MNTIQQIDSVLIRLLYWVCRVAASPLLVFYFVYRCARDRRYSRRFRERLGGLPASFQATPPGAIWLHAVSVGEVISAAGLLRQLRSRSPSTPLYVSVTTVAGREVAQEKLAGIADGIFYAPIDYAFAVRRALRRLQPTMLVVLETEIWPVLYREAKRRGLSLLILNGRISDRAFPRYLRWAFLFRRVLRLPDAILTQTEQDRTRYIQIGAPEGIVHTLGNLKYDAAPERSKPAALITQLLEKLRPETVWIAASTMPGADSNDVDEDDAVLGAFQELAPAHPGLLLILVPRKPERFDAAEQRLRAAGLCYVRRSQNRVDPGLKLPCVVLLDTIGELAGLFPLADIVFMGGSLARRGGHNLLEPATSARPIVIGPHMENFAAIAAEFRQEQAVLTIATPGELSEAVSRLIRDPQLRQRLGERAEGLAAKRRGATQQAVDEIWKWYDFAIPCPVVFGPAGPLLWLLSKIWTAGGCWKARYDQARARRLATPVVSIGGISMGGTGKTPMVDSLACRLRELGHQPAILTRGYRRRSIAKQIAVKAGEKAAVDLTGDEAQIFVQSGCAHVGIGADRWASGRLLEEKFQPGLFILDDGFQHRRLARDLDIVLIDALNPLAGGAVFPLGYLREPWAALRRADVFLIMRAALGRDYRGIEERLRSVNPRAPVFRAIVEPRYWVNYRTKRQEQPPQGPAGAFCGLANPASFWATLKSLEIEPAFRWTFPDHHSYTHQQFSRLLAQTRLHHSTVLLTTEKDVMNLPEEVTALLAASPVSLYWLKIGVRILGEADLISAIESKSRKLRDEDPRGIPLSRLDTY
jgi:3-deoxy-D-manno-octulosonic-acid transferase